MNDEKPETDTWFVMADGTHSHPADVDQGDDGVMRHKESGVHVALRDNGLPLTSGVATKTNRQAAEAGTDSAAGKARARRKAREAEGGEDRAIKADEGNPAGEYETR